LPNPEAVWAFELDDASMLGDLLGALEDPDPDPDPSLYYLRKALVGQFDGFKVHIYSKEHPPPHFRVEYSGETADFRITDCERIAGGLTKHQRRIRAWHKRNKKRLAQVWNARRPTDCPVGAVSESDA
jgi:hypothetical protein